MCMYELMELTREEITLEVGVSGHGITNTGNVCWKILHILKLEIPVINHREM